MPLRPLLLRLAAAPGQAGIALAGVVASFALMVAMAIMVGSFRDSVDRWLGRVLAAPLVALEKMLTVDGSALQQFDSSALAVLLECQRMARARGRAFSVQSLPTKLTELAGLYGVDGLLQSG